MKSCFICQKEKELNDFYLHKQMTDGHLNKCKECCKKQSKEREQKLRQNPIWIESEKVRAREKYHRLYSDGQHYPSKEKKSIIINKYKEKYPEKYLAKKASSKLLKTNNKNHLHHWSYNEEHWKDCIELSILDHNLLHRNMIYDQNLKLYRNSKGEILDSKESHILLLEQCKQF